MATRRRPCRQQGRAAAAGAAVSCPAATATAESKKGLRADAPHMNPYNGGVMQHGMRVRAERVGRKETKA